eukprot:CAMPEP_0116853492 /NCGR_PEP_ID=MMETSP0418-20121206/17943_1 /TAXON_ID=1158023 /ORGANISM="Astrosyne radiata, Strain 13vi08-1A" /LENGTH=102 /DNA_ID=CAMNT_0004485901 /DNA_START=1 /DNA_END=309 /DNA_ORIENTATION=+
MTRTDFPISVRKDFTTKIQEALSSEKPKKVTIHYGSSCPEDVRQMQILESMLPKKNHDANVESSNVQLVAHDYDDHILSLHLKNQGKLQGLVDEAIGDFLAS